MQPLMWEFYPYIVEYIMILVRNGTIVTVNTLINEKFNYSPYSSSFHR